MHHYSDERLMMERPRVSDEQIKQAYAIHGSVWKAGEALGLCGQSIHERLIKLGVPRKYPALSANEKREIREVYASGIVRGDGKLQMLSVRLGRTIPFISRYAKTVGLTSYNRKVSPNLSKQQGERVKRWIAENGHPKGMLGKTHTRETLRVLSARNAANYRALSPERKREKVFKMLKTKQASGTLLSPRKASWKSGWYEVNGSKFFFRSKWEHNYALILEIWRQFGAVHAWEYEPDTFWFEKIKRGVRSYTPDFKVTWPNGSTEYHEVKGWMDDKSKTKLKRMAKYHPKIKMVVIESRDYKALVKRWL